MSEDELISVDHEKCIKCGLCVDICPINVLEMSNNGPESIMQEACNSCGHCVAICPCAALDHKRNCLAEQIDLKKDLTINAETAYQFLRSRRSIRNFKELDVSREHLSRLLDVAHYAPTASNRQGISYIVVDDKKVIERASEIVIEWMEEEVKKEAVTHWSFPYHIQMFRKKGIDTILRKAPSLVLAVSEKTLEKGRENTIFSLTYLELFAPSLGMGSCWAGLFEMCVFSGYRPIIELFNIPENYKFTGALMVGYPKYSFKRLVSRNPLNVMWMRDQTV